MPMCLLNMTDAQLGFRGLTIGKPDCHCKAEPEPSTTTIGTTKSDSATTTNMTRDATPAPGSGMIVDLAGLLQGVRPVEGNVCGRCGAGGVCNNCGTVPANCAGQIALLPVRIPAGLLRNNTTSTTTCPANEPQVTSTEQLTAVAGLPVLTMAHGDHCHCCRCNTLPTRCSCREGCSVSAHCCQQPAVHCQCNCQHLNCRRCDSPPLPAKGNGRVIIPSIVYHSPSAPLSNAHPSDPGVCWSTTTPTTTRSDLQHSRSFREAHTRCCHERRQMGGGHLSIRPTSPLSSTSASTSLLSTMRQHRHSTGSVLENVNLQNELNTMACANNAMCGTSTTLPAMRVWAGNNAQASPEGSVAAADSLSPSPPPPRDHVYQNSDVALQRLSSNSGESVTMRSRESSLSPWTDLSDSSDPCGAARRSIPSSPCPSSASSGSSSSSTGETSGSSVSSWAANFTGAAENALHWKTLKVSQKKLEQSGFYYVHMSMEQAKQQLQSMPVGSFLVRDSANKHYMFSLSAVTRRGVTSVRIEYRNAKFRFDSDEKCAAQMPGFDCLLKLVQYYMHVSENRRTASRKCVWLESSGRKDTPVLLRKPAIFGVQSLKHMCRKVIHRHVSTERQAQHLKTDSELLQYLKDYPYYI